jgi:hypothetical protein
LGGEYFLCCPRILRRVYVNDAPYSEEQRGGQYNACRRGNDVTLTLNAAQPIQEFNEIDP